MRGFPPSECGIELFGFEQVTQPVETRKSFVLHIRKTQMNPLESAAQFGCSSASIPVKLKIRKGSGELTEVSLIGTLIRATLRAQFQLTAGHRLHGNFGKLDYLMIQFVGACIE